MTTQQKQLEQAELDPEDYQELPEEWYVSPTEEELSLRRALDIGIEEDKKKKAAIRNWIIIATLAVVLAYPVVWAIPAAAHLLWSVGFFWCLVGFCMIAVPAFLVYCIYLMNYYRTHGDDGVRYK